jgi:hypothetical protein
MNVVPLEVSFTCTFPFITTADKNMAEAQTFDVEATLKGPEMM